MSGTGMRIVKRMVVEQGANVAQNTTGSETPLVTNIPVAGYRYAILIARLHAVTWGGGANTTLTFRLRNSAPTDEDPAQSFRVLSTQVIAAPIVNAGTAGSTNQGAVAPFVIVVASTADFGTHLDLTMQLSQGPTGNANNVFNVSLDLALKS